MRPNGARAGWLPLLPQLKRVIDLRYFIPILALALLGGCATSSVGGDPSVKVVEPSAFLPPEGEDNEGQTRPYRIGAFDKLEVDVFGIEELSKREVQADSAGRFSFPLIGVVDASGKTPIEVEKVIAERLKTRFVKDPQVTVNLKQIVSQVVTVDGAVREPGLYPVLGKMTLIRAIATAKGTSEFARESAVIVFRTVRGQRMIALYNLGAIRRGAYPDPAIYANDLIVVDESAARRYFKDFVQLSPLLGSVVVAAFR